MKGIVFSEFLEMIEQKFGYEMVDIIITESDLPSGGSYTAVGTYDFSEMQALLTTLHQKTNIPVNQLLNVFGRYLFGTFEKGYSTFLEAADNAFDFLSSIETYIHVEVRKLYPDAELPTFETKLVAPNQLEMIYHSERRMGAFAEGLIESSFQYFKEEAQIVKEPLNESGTIVRFEITKI